jgi:dUTP pyrophosphatase
MMQEYVKVKKLHNDAKLPTKATPYAACWDLYSDCACVLTPGVVTIVPTGLAMEVPEGYVLEIVPRSGLAAIGCTVVNSPGKVDADYRGEIKIIMTFLGEHIYRIKQYERVAQCSLVKLEDYTFWETEELSTTERGEGGFGSTGKL